MSTDSPDLNAVHAAGVDLKAMVELAKNANPILPTEITALGDAGLAKLTALCEFICAAQDGKVAVDAIAAFRSSADLRGAAVAFHLKPQQVAALLERMRMGPRGVKGPVDRLERAILKEEEDVQAQTAEREEAYEAKVITALVRELGVKELRAPSGYTVGPEGVTAPGGVLLSRWPIVLLGALVDADDERVKLEVAWKTKTGWKRKAVDREIVLNHRKITTLLGDGAPVDSMVAGAMVKYLSSFEAENNFVAQRSSSHMGWVGDRTFLWGSTAIGEPMQITVDEGGKQLVPGFRRTGTYDGWKAIIENDVKNFPLAMCGIYASCASALLRCIHRPGFIFEWSGDSSHGKTTCGYIAGSCWGYPAEGEDGVIQKWNTPGVTSLLYKAWFNNSLPLFLDETKEQPNREIISRVIFSHVSGQDASRGKPDGSIHAAKRWRSVLISTGEAPITSFSGDQGARARCLCIVGMPFGEASAEGKARTERIAYDLTQHHGWLGPMFVEFLLANRHKWSQYQVKYTELSDHYAEYGKSAISKRLFSNVAVLRLTAEFLHQELGLPGDWEEPMEALVSGIQKAEVWFDQARNALDALYTWACSNEEKFWKRKDNAREPNGGWLGRWEAPNLDGSDNYWREIGFVKKEVVKILEADGFRAADVISTWDQRGWTRKDNAGKDPGCAKGGGRLLCLKRDALEPESGAER